MDQLFASLAISGASLVGKAAFSLATNAAIRKVESLVNDSTVISPIAQRAQLQKLQLKLEFKLSVVNPAMDMCEFLAHKNPSLEPLVTLSQSLRKDFDNLKHIAQVDEMMASIDAIVQELEDIVPFLQLALQTLGSMDRFEVQERLPLSRVLRSSRWLDHPSSKGILGPVLKVCVYSLFFGSSRKKHADWSWKEEFAQGYALVHKTEPFNYDLLLVEDLDDGRYHEEEEVSTLDSIKELLPKFKCGKARRLPLGSLRSIYFTSCGSLLKIENAREPALVFKMAVSAHDASDKEDWWAISRFVEDADANESSDEERPTKDKNSNDVKKDGTTDPSGSLSDFEYLLRLASVECIQQTNHASLPDDVLESVLSNSTAGSLLTKDEPRQSSFSEIPLDDRETSATRPRTMGLGSPGLPSPLAKKGNNKFIDKLRQS